MKLNLRKSRKPATRAHYFLGRVSGSFIPPAAVGL
jgi:hypothetical protein